MENKKQEKGGGKGGKHGMLFRAEEASLASLLSRCGYIAEKKCGKMRGQKRILDILLCHPHMSQKALQHQLEIKPGSMSEIIVKMEMKGLICRERDEKDHRKMVIRLTEEGRKKAEENRGDPQEEEIFQILSREEKTQLRETLIKLLVQWREEREEERASYEN